MTLASLSLSPRHMALLTGAFVLLLGAGSAAGTLADHRGDVWHYYCVSGCMLHGQWPYRDFPLEYPPLALLPFLVPRLLGLAFGGGYCGYVWLFLFQSAFLTSALAGTTLRIAACFSGFRSPQTVFLLLTGLIVAASPTLPWRYDVFPALLTALALRGVLAGRAGAAGFWLGLGAAAKLYPLVLLPVFGLFYLVSRQKTELRRFALACTGGAGLCFLPFLNVGLAAPLSFFRYHAQRGLEIESAAAGLLLLAHTTIGLSVSVVYNYGADHLVCPAAPAVLSLLPFVFLSLTMLALGRFGREFRREWNANSALAPQTLARAVVALLTAFLLADKVFSPQYLIWLVPFAPLLSRRVTMILLALFALTALLYSLSFSGLLTLSIGPILLLNLRNLALFLTFAALLNDAPFLPSLAKLPLSEKTYAAR